MINQKIKSKIGQLTRQALIFSIRVHSAQAFFWFSFAQTPQLFFSRRKNILYIQRPVFDDEINGLKKQSEFNFVPMSARICKTVLRAFVAEDEPSKVRITDVNYVQAIKQYPEERKRLYLFWVRFFSLARRYKVLSAVISANFNYLLQQEMCNAAIAEGIPVITIYKEGMGPRKIAEKNVTLNRKQKYSGTRIIFYNEFIRENFLQIEGITRENSCAIGFPRIPKFNPTVSCGGSTFTLFVSPLDQKSTWYPEYVWETLELGVKIQRFYFDFLRAANKYTKKRFVIKFKVNNQKRYFFQVLEKNGIAVPRNCEIVGSGDPTNVFQDTAVAFGHGTTALLESLYWGSVVVEPMIVGLDDGWSLFSKFSSVVNLVQNQTEIEGIVDGNVLRPDRELVRKVLEHYFGRLDGRGYERLASEIRETIENHKPNSRRLQ